MLINNNYNYLTINNNIFLSQNDKNKINTSVFSSPVINNNINFIFNGAFTSFRSSNQYSSFEDIPEIKEYKAFIKEKNLTPENIVRYKTPEEIANFLNIDVEKFYALTNSCSKKYTFNGMPEKISRIPNIFLLKLLCVDNVKNAQELESKYYSYLRAVSEKTELGEHFNLDKTTAENIVILSFDIYGIPNNNKLKNIETNILPALKNAKIAFTPFITADVRRLLTSENFENDIEIIKFCRKIAEREFKNKDGSYNINKYEKLLTSIQYDNQLNLYKNLYANNFNSDEIYNILNYANNSKTNFFKDLDGNIHILYGINNIKKTDYNLNIIEKIKSFKPLFDKYNFKLDYHKTAYFTKGKSNYDFELDKLLKSENPELDIKIIKFCREAGGKEFQDECNSHGAGNYFDLLNLINSEQELKKYRYLFECGYETSDIYWILHRHSMFTTNDKDIEIMERAYKFSNFIKPYIKNSELRLGKLLIYFSPIKYDLEKDKNEIINQTEILKNTMSYFIKNTDKLSHHDMEISKNQTAALINENYGSIIETVDIIGQSGMNTAIGLKFSGLETFFETIKSLKNLPPEIKELLKEKLALLPHPEQKFEKLSVISHMAGKINNDAIEQIIENIKSPEMTKEQIELANEIFADKNKDYEEQIKDFIIKFKVPENKQQIIIEFLHKNNIKNAYETPLSAQKQKKLIEEKIKIINGKINSLSQNKNIPEKEKQIGIQALINKHNLLVKKYADISENPKKYTNPRIKAVMMKNLAQKVQAHINLPNNNELFNRAVNKEIYVLYNINTDETSINKNINYDCKYFAKLFSGASDYKFKTSFIKLINLLNKNPENQLSDVLNSIPENRETHRLFFENGLDYFRWINFDENSRLKFTANVNVKQSLQAVKDNLINEFTTELAQNLDKNELSTLFEIINNMNIEKADKKDLPKIIKAMENHMEKSSYWNNSNDFAIKTFKDHLKIHKKNIHDITQLKNKTEELYVRLWNKNDTGRNLFFGNHVGCCTAVGNYNAYAAPQHLMNSFVNGIEIVDDNGNSFGNSMCYFAKVDGKLTFIIDSFEASGKLGASQDVTSAVIKYAKQVCKEMKRPDAIIMFGPNYNKLDFSKCKKTRNHTVEIIGSAPEKTYIDAIGGYRNINTTARNREMIEVTE